MIVNQALGSFDIDPPPDEKLENIPIVAPSTKIPELCRRC